MEADKWEELDLRAASAIRLCLAKECSCECVEYVICQGTLEKARRVILDKGHLKSVVVEGAISQFAHG